MKGISVSTCFNYDIDFCDQLELIHKAGFSHVSIGTNYSHSGILESDNVIRIREIVRENNLLIDIIHGCSMDNSDTVEVNKILAKASEKLNVPVIVVHCSSFTFNPDTFDQRKKDIITKLPIFEDFAKTYNVSFAFENVLPGVATDLTGFAVNNSNPEYFGFCYDSAHDQIDGPRSFDLLRRNISRLKAVHISDRIREFVDHVIPGEGFIDFDEIAKIIHMSNPDIPLLMEVSMEHSKFKNAKQFLSVTYNEAKKIYNTINKQLK